MSDEIYDRLIFEGTPRSIASFPGFKDRTIILDGFSKTYAMTGWRIGYGVMNRELAENDPKRVESGISIGILNVNARLKKLFGDDYGIHIDSTEGEGTTVTVTVPVITEEEHEQQ